ncbi:hypothetical protein CcI49_12970 [Frankia sp. CcI49]|uniref:hypothetical protein n=1 Tax=Frankia sp. CcI49 TaxID=1745382 RepID=UPI000976EC00|nr:hypothetical protein [Frankia sp. CcI49]ONH60377.1 hypothetical protein CcI49_12970 [Frankia sp. CcI49]
MLPFDSNDYRSRVLAAVHARGGAEQSDPFEIYDIPIEEAARLGDAEVRARIDEVWAFWQRSRDHPRYRGVIIALLGLHGELSAALRTTAARTELAGRVTAARTARDGERFAELDAAVRRLVSRFGGLPEDKIAGLRALAATHGIDDAAFELRIRRHRRLPAGTAERATATSARRPVSAEVIRQVRADLDELGRIVGTTPPRSLFDLLGVTPESSREEIRAVRDAAAARNRERRPDRRRALLDDLLTAARALLVDGDPEAYLDALVEPVKAVLRPRVATAVLIEDRLLATAAAEFVAQAVAEGLDQGRARAVVADLAREHGVEPPETGRLTSPSRPGSGAAQGGWTGGGPATGGSAGAAETTGSDAPTRDRPASRPVPARASDWQALLSRARAELRAGRPIAASGEIARARELAGETLPPIRALDDEVERVIRDAGERWQAIIAELTANRHRAALGLVEALARLAADVPGPGGRLLEEVRALALDQCAQADELVRRARTSVGPDRVRLVRAAVALVADHEEALALLAEPAAGAAGPGAQSGGTGSSTAGSRAETSTGPAPSTRQPSTRQPSTEQPSTEQPSAEPLPVQPLSAQPRPAETPAAEPASVEPPTGVAARWDGSSVVISWRRTVTPGDVSYRIRRITADGKARAVGVTPATVIEDGGVFRGSSIPEYEVIAGIGGVWSKPARWPDPADPAGTAGTADAAGTAGTADAAGTAAPADAGTADAGAAGPGAAGPGAAEQLRSETGGSAQGSVDGAPPDGGKAGAAVFEVPPPGPRTAADEIGPASDLRMEGGRLCWTWPAGCTEMMVTARADLPPAGAQELGATTRKITNTRYDIDGGFLPPDVRPLHVALFACVRERGELVVAGAAAGRVLIDASGGLTVVGPGSAVAVRTAPAGGVVGAGSGSGSGSGAG